MRKTIFFVAIVILASSLVLNDELNVWFRMFMLIMLLAIVWLEASTRQLNQTAKLLHELNEEVKKCLTSLKP